MITFRPFRNADPPLIVGLWNTCISGPRAIPAHSATLLEYFLFAKPQFDPAGLLLAFDGSRPVGFALASRGFDHAMGVISALGVMPTYRRRGIGRQLLGKAEAYLRRQGVRSVTVGGMPPDNPFLFGLYGGCDTPGILTGEKAARPFLEKHGYTIDRACGLFQLPLPRWQMPPDPRWAGIRGRYDIMPASFRHAGPWRESVLGPVEAVEYRLQSTDQSDAPARMVLWDMDTFCQHWGESCVGLLDLRVEESHRRQGLAKYLLGNVLRHLRERSFGMLEARADLRDTAMLGLLQSFGFGQVDAGSTMKKGLE